MTGRSGRSLSQASSPGQRKERKASPAPHFSPQALRSQHKSEDRQGGGNSMISVLFIKSIQKAPERKGQGSLVEAT